VQVTYQTEACEDWDFSSEDEEIFERVEDAGVVQVSRIGLIRGCDDVFSPDIEAEGWEVIIWEEWAAGGQSVDECSACRVAAVVMEGDDAAALEIHWFDESSAVTPVWSSP